jgi:HD-GYP domain-containing protein (c-di-GMP phosphodiesterase class II)
MIGWHHGTIGVRKTRSSNALDFNNGMTAIAIDLRRVVYALSDALDLVGINDLHHGKRVGIMATDIAQTLGWTAARQKLAFDAGLLHDIGVSSTDLHRKLVEDFDWDGAQGHAEFGAYLLGGFAPLADLAPAVRDHHTHWSDLNGLTGEAAEMTNLIFLADRVDVLAASAMAGDMLLASSQQIRSKLGSHAGTLFKPALVDGFLRASRKESFWLGLEPNAVRDYMAAKAGEAGLINMDIDSLLGIAQLFSRVVDAKSHFTVEHSEGVARLVRFLGERFGLDADTCGKLEVAGYLHDIGKLRIPDGLLEKPGPLSEDERRLMASHAYETYRILAQIPGFEDISQWAAYHHEIPDGEGYPFHLEAAALSQEARLLRGADIFQALAQDRPYRSRLPAKAILDHLRRLQESGKLDLNIFLAIEANLDNLYEIAQSRRVDNGVTRAR